MSASPRPFVYDPPPAAPLIIIHRDEHLLVLDKPSGLLTVPGKPKAHADCLISRVQVDYPEARIIHRLDMDTSGIIVLARTAHAQAHIGKQFEKRQTKKSYIAIVDGRVTEDHGRIDQPLMTDWPNRPKQHIDLENGRAAVTDWAVLSRDEQTTRIRLFPLTGRSHQLRVHLQFLGHPILGDNLYAPDAVLDASDRLCLHAETLELRHPDGGAPISFNCPAPF